MRVTATDAKNRFGALCLQAKTAPVVVEKAGAPDTVLLSYADYQRLTAPAASASMAARRRAFNAEYKDWIEAQNRHFDAQGLWNDEFRLW